jgi:hypothetical protein
LIVLGAAVAACGDNGSDGSVMDAVTTLPPAADGTDLTACTDGTCEVEMSDPVDIPLTDHPSDITMLSVVELTADGLDFTTTSDDGATSSGAIGEGCITTLSSGGGGSSCSADPDQEPPPPPSFEPGALTMQVVGAADGTVVLRLGSD